MTTIHVTTEQDSARGWRFTVDLEAGQRAHRFDVTLSWSDYDHWSHGRVAPEKVVEAIFRFLLDKEPVSAIMSKFDCAVVRRYFPEVDRELPKRL
jgi:hypothetical protein